MSIVALCGQKGGAGKTTCAVNLASEWHRQGFTVLLVDLDPQGTATTWGDVAAETEVAGPAVIGMGDAVRAKLPGIAQNYDRVVIDCPPRAGARTVGALMVADLAILPCGPSPADLWAIGEALEVVEQARMLRPELEARIVLNAVVGSSTLGQEVGQALAELPIATMKSILRSRVDFARAMATGQGVTVVKGSSLAAHEVCRWVAEVDEVLGLTEAEEGVA